MSRFRNETDYKNQEFEFFINGKCHQAKADYTLENKGEESEIDYPGYSETKITDLHVYDAMIYSDDLDEYVSISVTNEIEEQVMQEIEKYHKL